MQHLKKGNLSTILYEGDEHETLKTCGPSVHTKIKTKLRFNILNSPRQTQQKSISFDTVKNRT